MSTGYIIPIGIYLVIYFIRNVTSKRSRIRSYKFFDNQQLCVSIYILTPKQTHTKHDQMNT